LQLTVRPFSGLSIKRTCSFGTVVLLDLSRIATDKLMLFRKSSCDAQLMKPGFTPLVLFPNPSASYKVSLA
jgi:hypothetical protein